MANTTHGLTRGRRIPPEYIAWRAIKARCFNPRREGYHRYGGRGITMDPIWRQSFPAFLAAVGPKPSPAYTLDRIDNDGSYVPGNVRWATKAEQRANCHTTVWITFRGERRRLWDWAQHLGVPYARLQKRILRGWSVERVLTTPRGPAGRKPWPAPPPTL